MKSFICPNCGDTHEGSPKDYGWKLPDAIWAIPKEERDKVAKYTSDLCEYAGRYFIRCVLSIPMPDFNDSFGWGIWVEIEQAVFQRYVEIYDTDVENELERPGYIANKIPTYPDFNEEIRIQFGDSSSRPAVYCQENSMHPIAVEQRQGMDAAHYHEIVELIGSGLKQSDVS